MAVSVKFCLIGEGLAAGEKEHRKRREFAPAVIMGEPGWLSYSAGGLESDELKRRLISAPVCAEAGWIVQAARAQRASSLRAHFRARHRAPNKCGRRAVRSLPLSDGSHSLAVFLPLAMNSSSSWAYSPPFDPSLHSTSSGKPSPQNFLENQSKDPIHRIKETGSAEGRECGRCSKRPVGQEN